MRRESVVTYLPLAKKTCFRLVFVEVDVRGANALREAAALSDLHAKVTNFYERVISCDQSLRAFRGVA